MKIFISIAVLFFATTKLHAQSYEKTSPNPSSNSNTKGINDEVAKAIVDKHNDAVGGAAAFDSFQSVVREGIQNYYGTVETIKITYEKGKLVRHDAEYNGQKGYWMITKKEGGEYFPWESPQPVKFSAAYLRIYQGNLHSRDYLLNYKADSSQLLLLAKDTINGAICSKIQLVTKRTNLNLVYWIDDATFMVLRFEKHYITRNKSSDRFKTIDRFDYSDYRLVGNVKLHFGEKFKTIINKKIVGEKETMFSKIEINQPVNPMLYHINPGIEVTSSEYYNQ
jgi:hypothetical protein